MDRDLQPAWLAILKTERRPEQVDILSRNGQAEFAGPGSSI